MGSLHLKPSLQEGLTHTSHKNQEPNFGWNNLMSSNDEHNEWKSLKKVSFDKDWEQSELRLFSNSKWWILDSG